MFRERCKSLRTFVSHAEVQRFLAPYRERMAAARDQCAVLEQQHGPDPEWLAMGLSREDALVMEAKERRVERSQRVAEREQRVAQRTEERRQRREAEQRRIAEQNRLDAARREERLKREAEQRAKAIEALKRRGAGAGGSE